MNQSIHSTTFNASTRYLAKITLTVTLLTMGIGCTALAQESNERNITINMSASEQLPADQIIFNVNINAEESTPQAAFEKHKMRENLLANLLKELNIKEENISYQPIRINKQYRNRGSDQVSVTSQSVSLTFTDFSIYEKIQITLIENGFDSFNGRFSSTEISKGKEKALISAIEAAKNRAQLIAETSGVVLGEIKTINYSDHQVSYAVQNERMDMAMSTSNASMMDFAQTVTVTANINISFSLKTD